jgi:Raf kinase inhibitor-like YbhB/YbcL family protein
MYKPWSVVASVSFSLAVPRLSVLPGMRHTRARRPSAAARAAAALGLALGLGANPPAFAQATFTLASKDLMPGKPVGAAYVYDGDGCNGKNESPHLQWSGAPPGTKSFAITMFDPDAPGRGWWHWAVAGIPADVRQLPSNASASGFLKKHHAVEARNDFDKAGYSGPCPPRGQPHRYIVTVYALGTDDLRLGPGRPAMMFDHEIGTTVLGKASITVTYGR